MPGLPLTESECKLYLIVTLSVALTFCVLSASIVMAACVKRFQAVKSDKRRRQKLEEEREKEREEEEKKKVRASLHMYTNYKISDITYSLEQFL